MRAEIAYRGIGNPWLTALGARAPTDTGGVDRAALADFLRRHRQALHPADVGPAVGRRRRAVGLRREEVAALAAMSTDYYTRLEQKRAPKPSEQMLESLARALRLSSDERDYLFRIAGRNPPESASAAAHVAPPLLRVLDRLNDTPAVIMSNLCVALVQNRMADALFGDRRRYTGPARSEIYRWFTDASERLRYCETDRDRQSRAMVAQLRDVYGSMGPRSQAGELVRALRKASPEFEDIWDRHEVGKRFVDYKTIIHPQLGPIELDCQALFNEDRSQLLLVYTAAPGSESHEKLQLLAAQGQEQLFEDTAKGDASPGGA